VIVVCESCGRAMFPRRLLCPDCGGREFRDEPAGEATLEDFSDRGDVNLGQVRARGAVLIARLEIDDPQRGMQVNVDFDGDIPVAHA
jgi:uncharacterized OB-fold protein